MLCISPLFYPSYVFEEEYQNKEVPSVYVKRFGRYQIVEFQNSIRFSIEQSRGNRERINRMRIPNCFTETKTQWDELVSVARFLFDMCKTLELVAVNTLFAESDTYLHLKINESYRRFSQQCWDSCLASKIKSGLPKLSFNARSRFICFLDCSFLLWPWDFWRL